MNANECLRRVSAGSRINRATIARLDALDIFEALGHASQAQPAYRHRPAISSNLPYGRDAAGNP